MIDNPLLNAYWLIFTTILGCLTAFLIIGNSPQQMLKKKAALDIPAIILAGFSIVWIGFRPIWCYGDTMLYTEIFSLVQMGIWSGLPDFGDEWLFRLIEEWFIDNSNQQYWLVFIALMYISLAVAALWKWMPGHLFLALVFLFCSYSFFTYGTNGIRNGMATSMGMLGMAFASPSNGSGKFRLPVIGLGIVALSIGVHASMALVLGACIIAMYFRKTQIYCTAWLFCIFLSLIATEPLKELFAFLVDDNRMSLYLENTATDDGMFSKSGFRWDFILYSSVPIVLGYYAIVKKGVQDATYTFLINVYIIANSFWCLINSAAYSNRFAYLSWFLMPVLICYPLVKFRLFKSQGFVCGLFLIGSVVFNWLF